MAIMRRRLSWVLWLLPAALTLGAGTALAAGAIAFSEAENYGFITSNYPDARAAQQAALKGCRYGDCRVVMDFQQECASIAVGDDGYGWGAAASKAEARMTAMTQCSQTGRNCEELLSECDR